MESDFRAPDPRELAIIETLLAYDFPGSEQLRLQLKELSVRQIDPEGSLQFNVKHLTPAHVVSSVPIEASYSDTGNPDPFSSRVRLLLHVRDGILHELEIYKDDGSDILKMPGPQELMIEINPAN